MFRKLDVNFEQAPPSQFSLLGGFIKRYYRHFDLVIGAKIHWEQERAAVKIRGYIQLRLARPVGNGNWKTFEIGVLAKKPIIHFRIMRVEGIKQQKARVRENAFGDVRPNTGRGADIQDKVRGKSLPLQPPQSMINQHEIAADIARRRRLEIRNNVAIGSAKNLFKPFIRR